MNESWQVENGEAEHAAAILAAGMIQHSCRARFLGHVLPLLLIQSGAVAGGLICQSKGTWQTEFWHVVNSESTISKDTNDGDGSPIDSVAQQKLVGGLTDAIGDAMDRAAPHVDGSWCIIPVGKQSAWLMRVLPPRHLSHDETESLSLSGKMLASALDRLDAYQTKSRRVRELSAILSAAASWQRIDDDDELLRAIADTATDLLKCERASIFLWDKRRKKLIGRPALGVEGESLSVDDDSGVVGEVLSTAEPKIWNADSDDGSRVNRKIDAKTDFETKSLVAVPMFGDRDQVIGVFEAINAIGHAFDPGNVDVLSDLATHAAVAIGSLRTRRKLTQNRDRLVDDAASQTELIGQHPSMEAVRKQAQKIAGTDLSVLILGKNGTGKEVLARMVHYQSERRNGPFVAVNCAALVETLLESELFGHEKGAFTDANQSRRGKFELASGGTLFLDEVGDMSPGGQAKLLRVLEDKVVVKVGGSQATSVDVRVLAATNQPLEELIAQRKFREDLFFRLNVVSLTLPPLSQRGDDVLLLANHFLAQFCYQIGRPVPKLDADTQAVLLSHPWPGNIRQLRNTIERVCYLCTDDTVSPDDLMLSGGSTASTSSVSIADLVSATTLTDATKEFQVEHIQNAIEKCGGNMTEAAGRLGLHRSNLYRKMRQLQMPTSGEG